MSDANKAFNFQGRLFHYLLFLVTEQGKKSNIFVFVTSLSLISIRLVNEDVTLLRDHYN